MNELQKAESELARLRAERSEREKAVGELEQGLQSARAGMGSRVLAGESSHEVAVGLLAREAEVEAGRLAVGLLERSISDAELAVKAAQVQDYQSRADSTRRELDVHLKKVERVLSELKVLEQTDGLTVQNWKEPRARSGRLAAEAEYLSSCAFRLGHGLTVLPREELPIPSWPE